MYYDNDFANRIVEYRAKHGLTQAKFAQKAGVSTVTVLQLEKGTTRPTALTRGKIELALKEEE